MRAGRLLRDNALDMGTVEPDKAKVAIEFFESAREVGVPEGEAVAEQELERLARAGNGAASDYLEKLAVERMGEP